MKITSNIGNNQKSKPEDVIAIKRALNSLGLYNGDVNLPYIDAEMDRGIYSVQRSQGLKTDGLIKPGGETEKALIRLTAKSPQLRCVKCGGWHGGVHGDVCDWCIVKM